MTEPRSAPLSTPATRWRRGLVVVASAGLGVAPVAPPARADVKPALTVAIEGDRELGEYLGAECMTCHQASGQNDGIPAIIGLDPAHFIDVLKAYRDHRRENAVMRTVAAKFSDEELSALAVYFAGLRPTN